MPLQSLKGEEKEKATGQGTEIAGNNETPKGQSKRASPQGVMLDADTDAIGNSVATKGSPVEPIIAEDPMETEEERTARIEREMDKLHAEINAASAVLQIVPLGTDRYHRRYWVFTCLPGLYVEHKVDVSDDAKILIDEANRRVKASPDLAVAADSDLPYGMQPSGSSTTTSGSPLECTSAANPSSDQVQWSCYSTEDMVQSLIAVLNLRGIREHELRTKLLAQKSNIIQLLPKCPFQSSQVSGTVEPAGTVEPELPSSVTANGVSECSPKSANEFLELYLREQILDIEEKIYLGNLGHLRDVENRSDWRSTIETTGAAAAAASKTEGGDSLQLTSASTVKQEHNPEVVQPVKEITEDGVVVPVPPVVDPLEQLSRSLLQVQAGIEKKYLMLPLGVAVDEKHKRGSKKADTVKDSDLCLEQWKTSLAKSTSYAQIFVHLATLERAVMWSRSLMNVRCRICRRKGGDEYMLLCDGCDHGYHMYCLRPPLVDVPEGDWFCYDCKPLTPSKTRKRTQRVPIIENSSESEEEEKEEEEYRSEEEQSGEQDVSDEEGDVATRKPRRSKASDSVEVRRSSRLQNSGEKKPESKPKSRGPRRRVSFVPEPSPCSKSSSGASPQLDSNQGRKRPRSEQLQASPFLTKAEGIVAAIIDLRCSQPMSKKATSSYRREQQTLELRLCEAIWDEVKGHQDSWPFSGPVKKREVSLPGV